MDKRDLPFTFVPPEAFPNVVFVFAQTAEIC